MSPFSINFSFSPIVLKGERLKLILKGRPERERKSKEKKKRKIE
jgi:hypothetical protein